MKRKDICKNGDGQRDFSHFLKWAKPSDDGKESVVLSAKSFDSDRNVMKNNLIVCGPSINGQSLRRKQFRRRKITKTETTNEIKIESQSPITIKKEIKKCLDEEIKTNEEENEDDDIENEDDDLKEPYIKRTKRRSTPILMPNIVFNKELIMSKVPILKKKNESDKLLANVPIFLNADEYEQLNEDKMIKMNEIKEEETKNEDCGVWGFQSLAKDKNKESKTWAHKLFGDAVKTNKVLIAKENELLVEAKKKERIHQIKIDSILPLPIISRESSVQYETSPSPTTTTTTTTTNTSISSICKPSSEAIEWRAKQINLGKETKGYINFIKIYPNKDLRFRLSNNLLSTPTKNERIGKKRWVGKYQKWRKFLHKFDEIDQEQQ